MYKIFEKEIQVIFLVITFIWMIVYLISALMNAEYINELFYLLNTMFGIERNEFSTKAGYVAGFGTLFIMFLPACIGIFWGIIACITKCIEFIIFELGIPKIKINVDVSWKYQQK